MENYLLIVDDNDTYQIISERTILGIKPFYRGGKEQYEISRTHFDITGKGVMNTSVIAKEMIGCAPLHTIANHAGWMQSTPDWIKELLMSLKKQLDELESKAKSSEPPE